MTWPAIAGSNGGDDGLAHLSCIELIVYSNIKEMYCSYNYISFATIKKDETTASGVVLCAR
jgi:hypothetical protein